MTPNPAVNRTVLGAASPASAAGYLSRWASEGSTVTALRPMQAATYPAYLEAAIHGYAQDNVSAGRWPQVGAIERSREDFESLLPHGLDTPDNFYAVGQFYREFRQVDDAEVIAQLRAAGRKDRKPC